MAGRPSPTIGDHYEVVDDSHQGGTYRVVGLTDDTVTLLRVTDAEGARRSTGEVVSVSRPMEGFASASNPDAGIQPLRWLRGQLQGLVWTVRMLTGL